MNKLFVSYRRVDNPFLAGRIRDRLAGEFGDSSVFFDVDSVPLGVDFRVVLRATLAESDAVIALIGPAWGVAKLHDRNDFVRIEIEEAIRQEKILIPVLVDETAMPSPDDLPVSMEKLAYLNALRIRPDPDFQSDMRRLAEGIRLAIAHRDRALHAIDGPAIDQVSAPSVAPPAETTAPALTPSEHSLPHVQRRDEADARTDVDPGDDESITVNGGTDTVTCPPQGSASKVLLDEADRLASDLTPDDQGGVALDTTPVLESSLIAEFSISTTPSSGSWRLRRLSESSAVAVAIRSSVDRIAWGAGDLVVCADLSTGEVGQEWAIEDVRQRPLNIAFSSTANRVAWVDWGSLVLADARTGRLLRSCEVSASTRITFSGDDSRIVSGSGIHAVADLGVLVQFVPSRAALSAQGRVVRIVRHKRWMRSDAGVIVADDLDALGTEGGTEVAAGAEIVAFDGPAYDLATAARESSVALAGSALTVYGPSGATRWSRPKMSYSVDLSPDGRFVAYEDAGALEVVDLSSGDVVIHDREAGVRSVRFDDGSGVLAVAGLGGVSVWTLD